MAEGIAQDQRGDELPHVVAGGREALVHGFQAAGVVGSLDTAEREAEPLVRDAIGDAAATGELLPELDGAHELAREIGAAVDDLTGGVDGLAAVERAVTAQAV